jgi:hypothetical protein
MAILPKGSLPAAIRQYCSVYFARVKVKGKTDLWLPEPGQFKAIIENIRQNPSGKGEDAADLVEFLAYRSELVWEW